jgi:hypothetical protein
MPIGDIANANRRRPSAWAWCNPGGAPDVNQVGADQNPPPATMRQPVCLLIVLIAVALAACRFQASPAADDTPPAAPTTAAPPSTPAASATLAATQRPDTDKPGIADPATPTTPTPLPTLADPRSPFAGSPPSVPDYVTIVDLAFVDPLNGWALGASASAGTHPSAGR